MPKVKPLGLRCPRCDAGPGRRCLNHKGRPCKPHKERRHVHIPKVDRPESYAESERSRTEIRHAALREFMVAVSHCGAGATAYARIRYKDRTGREPDRVFYVCRRPTFRSWCMKDGRQVDEAFPQFVYEELPIPYCLYGGRGQVIGPGYRWENRFEFIHAPEVQSAEQLQAAAEKRRAKALAKQQAEAERLAEWKRRNVAPSLFDLSETTS